MPIDVHEKVSVRYYADFNPHNKEQCESVFKVNLEWRKWSISAMGHDITITFWEEDNVFGWLERISLLEFMDRLDKNNLTLRIK